MRFLISSVRRQLLAAFTGVSAISGNVPVPEFLSWLAELETALVIEFPTRDDPRVAALLRRKKDGAHPDYDLKDRFPAPENTIRP